MIFELLLCDTSWGLYKYLSIMTMSWKFHHYSLLVKCYFGIITFGMKHKDRITKYDLFSAYLFKRIVNDIYHDGLLVIAD